MQNLILIGGCKKKRAIKIKFFKKRKRHYHYNIIEYNPY